MIHLDWFAPTMKLVSIKNARQKLTPGRDSYAGGDGDKGETLICEGLGVLHGEHIKGGLRDLVGRYRDEFVLG